MNDYDPNGDVHERLMYHTGGHPEIWGSDMIGEFQTYLREHPDAPLFFASLRFCALIGEQISELSEIAEEGDGDLDPEVESFLRGVQDLLNP